MNSERNRKRKEEKRKGMIKVTILKWNPMAKRTTYMTVWVREESVTFFGGGI